MLVKLVTLLAALTFASPFLSIFAHITHSPNTHIFTTNQQQNTFVSSINELIIKLDETIQENELQQELQLIQKINKNLNRIKRKYYHMSTRMKDSSSSSSHHHHHHDDDDHHPNSNSSSHLSPIAIINDAKSSLFDDVDDDVQGSVDDYRLVWSDEFNGNSLNQNNWGIELTDTPPNNEHEAYITDTISVGGGHLTITPRQQNWGKKNYVSGRINTSGKHNWLYGKFVTRAKTASFTGAWPAIWMLGETIGKVGWPKCGEIDVMEMVNQSWDNFGSIHFGDGGDKGGQGTYIQNHNYHWNQALGDDYHEYSVEWTADYMTFAVDGHDYKTMNLNNGDDLSAFKGASNFFLIINLAIGGDWPGHNIGQLGHLEVDWVRVYQKDFSNPGRSFHLVQNDNLCLDIPGGNVDNGAAVQVYACNGTPAQKFRVGGGEVRVGTDYCLDIENGSTVDGARVQIWQCSGGKNQQFDVVGQSLVWKVNGKCVDIPENKAGTPAHMWSCLGIDNQKYRIA